MAHSPDPRDLSDLLWCPHTAHPAKFARSNRAFCYSHLELHKHVVKDCDRALQLDPALLQAYVLKGLLPLMSLVYLSLFFSADWISSDSVLALHQTPVY